MLIYLIATLVACTVTLVTVLIAQLIPSRSSLVARRLAEIQYLGQSPFSATNRRDRQSRRERWEGILQELGERVGKERSNLPELRKRLAQAGYQGLHAGAIFWGLRLFLPMSLGSGAMLASPFTGNMGMLLALWLAIMGWVAPSFVLDRKLKRRQKEIRLALPDALDMMVTCVEAGLGLNQAIVRVSDEVRHISTEMAKELAMVNLEIRAGRPREEALRNLGERTGVDDLRALTTILIQTDRFGTSIAQALRVESDTLRTKRRQRAEEAAAKTAIKMLFPLVLCIFPSLFVVILGPAAIQVMESMVNK